MSEENNQYAVLGRRFDDLKWAKAFAQAKAWSTGHSVYVYNYKAKPWEAPYPVAVMTSM